MLKSYLRSTKDERAKENCYVTCYRKLSTKPQLKLLMRVASPSTL